MSTGREPSLSWLTLELYALGELDDAAAAAVAARLERDPQSQQCLELIRQQESRPLPPLPELDPAAEAGDSLGARLRAGLRSWRWAWASAAAVAVLAALLVARGPGGSTGESDAGVDGSGELAMLGLPGPRAQIKGGEIALAAVRARAGAITHDPRHFAPGDRFKIMVTCPPGRRLRGELAVYQSGQAAFPLPPVDLPCGNRAVIPGAFTITDSSPAAVCLSYRWDHPPSRAALRTPPDADRAVCMHLHPAP
ncbi:MAG: hypothetical protein AAGC55_07680 [Myxococcota bacterium]